jgi:UDP-2,3-diacylglucosamine pyrophosphatase LpxH
MAEERSDEAPEEQTTIARLLLRCEDAGGPAHEYVKSNPDNPNPPVPIDSQGDEIFVVSDLHLADGLGPDGRYGGNENFFCDSSFRRFLSQAHTKRGSTNAVLIINGDFVDFLRVMYVPREDPLLVDWQEILERVGIRKTIAQLKASISKKELTYGLKTNDFKSVLRLHIVIRGHAEFFEALAEWLGKGHRLIIVKGNHDLEWYWQGVRNYLRLVLAERLARQMNIVDIKDVLENRVLPNITFVDDALVIDEDVYIEHGNRYDKYAHVVGPSTLKNEERELNIPFGSFLNRYVLNDIELNYPFLDNVRPSTNILPLLMRERLPLALKLLFKHIPFVIEIIPKGYYRYMFSQVFSLFLVVLVLAGFIAWQIPGIFGHGLDLLTTPSQPQSILHKSVFTVLTSIGSSVLAYFIARAVARLNLVEPSDLTKYAREKFAEKSNYRLVTFGHTHNPDQFNENGRWFYNTGTWIPVVEISSAELREDKTYTFLHLAPDASGKLSGILQRWDDEAGRPEPAIVIKPGA